MNKLKTIIYLLIITSFQLTAQTPQADELVNIHDGTTAEMNSLTPDQGALWYNTEDTSLYVFDGAIWLKHKSDGSETYIVSGDHVTVTGTGTADDPYILNTIKPTLTDNGDNTFTFSNGIDEDVTFALTENTPPAIVSASDANGGCAQAFQENETRDVIITGENFDGATTVNIPGQTVNSVTITSATEIIANVTAGNATGPFNIEVTNSSGATSTLPDGFEVKVALITYDYAVADMAISTTQISYDGTTLTRTAGTGWSRSGHSTAYAIPAGEEGYLQFSSIVTNKIGMFGLDSNPTQSVHYNTIDYAIYLYSNGRIYIYENGSYKGQPTTYTTSDILEIKVECDGTVNYIKNGTIFFTSSTAATQDLYFDSSLYNAGSGINNISITY